MEKERIAIIETKIDNLHKAIGDFIESQKEHNKNFYETRDDVRDIKANAKGGWFVVGIFGSLTVLVSTLVSSIIGFIWK